MKRLRPEPKLGAIFLSFILLRKSLESCLSTRGALFTEHYNGYLDAKPFYVAEIQHSSECLLACERNNKCNAVNIKGKKSIKTCELLSGDSTTSRIYKSSTASYYEITQSPVIGVTEADKAVCQPECQYIPSCELSPLASCRCPSGTMVALKWNVVTVGSSNDNYATIRVNIPSGRYKLKLVSITGYLSCIGAAYMEYFTTFGCMKQDGTNEIRMVVTDTNNTALLPNSKGYSHDGKISKSVFITFNDPIDLQFGQDLRIWYKDDLENHSEHDNFGLTYIRVLALKID